MKYNDDVIGTIILEDNKISNIPDTFVEEQSYYHITSEVYSKKRKIYISKKEYEGCFNKIYSFSLNNSKLIEQDLLIRILNLNTNQSSIINENKGIKIQYKLCSLIDNIGTVLDYGKILVKNQIQDYFIIKKYGKSLTQVLKSKPNYNNLVKPMNLIKDILLTLNRIHKKKIAHLDLKPCNILLKDDVPFLSKKKNTKFVLIDFGSCQKVVNDKSIFIERQSASEGFSPPEFIDMKFGIKSDIWALGLIFYMILVRKFYFEADIENIFYSKINRKNKITNHLKHIWKYVLPDDNMTDHQLKKYIYPFSLNTASYLPDFFEKIFTFDEKSRSNTQELLNHKIFTLINP